MVMESMVVFMLDSLKIRCVGEESMKFTSANSKHRFLR